MIIDPGASRSFPARMRCSRRRSKGRHRAPPRRRCRRALARVAEPETRRAILVELGTECLGVHTGENGGREGSNVLGFAALPPRRRSAVRSRRAGAPAAIGAGRRSRRRPRSSPRADCRWRVNDFPAASSTGWCGPITMRRCAGSTRGWRRRRISTSRCGCGLGYPHGPIALLERSGLHHHFDVTAALFEADGDPGFAPARRARVAKERQRRGGGG